MSPDVQRRPGRTRTMMSAVAFASAAVVGMAACGSSSSKTATPSSGSTNPPSSSSSSVASTPSASSSQGAMFSIANVSGLGMVVVDGRGRTVYLLTADRQKNVVCDDASGCTKVWPDLALPQGTSAAAAGNGIESSRLSTM